MTITRRELGIYGALTTAVAVSGLAVARAGSANKFDVSMAVEEFRAAMVAGDGKTLNELADPGLSFGHSNGMVQTREEFVGSVVEKKEIFKSIKLTNKRLMVSGDIAIERHMFISDILLDGKPLSVELDVVEVWRMEDRWRLIVRQAFKT